MSATTSPSPVQPSVGPVARAAKTSSAAAPPSAAAAAPAARPEYASPRGGPGVNWRLVIMLSVVAIPFLWIGYMLVSQLVTGGVSRHGDYFAVDLKASRELQLRRDGRHGRRHPADLPPTGR